MSTSVCLYLSVREDIAGTIRAITTRFLCMLPMSVARSFVDDRPHRLSAGRVDGSAQQGSVIYCCLLVIVRTLKFDLFSSLSLMLHRGRILRRFLSGISRAVLVEFHLIKFVERVRCRVQEIIVSQTAYFLGRWDLDISCRFGFVSSYSIISGHSC